MNAEMFPASEQMCIGARKLDRSRWPMLYARLEELRVVREELRVEDLNDKLTLFECLRESARALYAVVANALLLFVYGYLIGHVHTDEVTCVAQSASSHVDTDEAACTSGGYCRPVRDKLTGAIIKRSDKIEAKYTPPGQSGNSLYLGRCATHEEARTKKKIAAHYYGRGEGMLDLGHGQLFQIPSVQMEQENGSETIQAKRIWVRNEVKKVYKSFSEQQKAIFRAPEVDYCTHLEMLLDESPSDMMLNNSQRQQQHDVQDYQVQSSAMVVPTFEEQVNPSHLETNGSVEEFPNHSEVAFDNNFRIEDVPAISLETFPDIVAQPEQPFESAQAQGPATGTLTSGDPVNACTVDGNAQHDSEASELPTQSWIPPSPRQGSDAEAVLDMRTELQPKDIDRDQRLQECLQTNEAPGQTNEAMRREKEALRQENEAMRREKEALRQENEALRREKEALRQENEALRQMLEFRDRKVTELELKLLCQRRTSQ